QESDSLGLTAALTERLFVQESCSQVRMFPRSRNRKLSARICVCNERFRWCLCRRQTWYDLVYRRIKRFRVKLAVLADDFVVEEHIGTKENRFWEALKQRRQKKSSLSQKAAVTKQRTKE